MMEFLTANKKSRNRKRKKNVKNKRRVQRKLEVKATARRKTTFSHDITATRANESQSHTMEARTFWENYNLAQDWQHKHSVAWWRSRCDALEHENHVLRQKVRFQAFQGKRQAPSYSMGKKRQVASTPNDAESDGDENDGNDENLEFQVDKDMLDFLEQSIRHKIELKKSRESEDKAAAEEAANFEMPFVTGEARIRAKMEDARLLYGESSPGIMAMEAALQATMDRHKDRAKPHYWPNIPLKP